MNETHAIEPLHMQGDCRIAELSEADRNRLTSVGGYLNTENTTDLTLPSLKSCRDLYASNSTNLSLPSLTSCGYLCAVNSTGLVISLLEKCRNLDADNSTDLTLPSLKSCRDLYARDSTGLNIPSLTSVGGDLFAFGSTGLVVPVAIAREHSIPAKYLAAVPEQSHADKAISELQSNDDTLNQGIK